MRKRHNLIFILILGFVILLSLVACDPKVDTNKLPPIIGGSDNGNTPGEQPSDTSAELKFTFPVEMSSVFNSIYVDEFNLSEYVKYSVVYRDETGAVAREVAYGGVTEEMIAQEDKPKLSTPGHHNINVTASLDNNVTVKGSFALHLKDRSGAVSLVKFTFKLKNTASSNTEYATPYFGTVSGTGDDKIVSVNVERGVTIKNWDEFLKLFPMSISGKALVRASGERITYSATNGFPFTVGGNENFTLQFTDDVITVKYDLNLPIGAEEKSHLGPSPKTLFAEGGKYFNVPVPRGQSISQPDDKDYDLYHGYSFAGWFNKADGKLWRFSTTVGDSDIELEAYWVLTEYTFTLYTMGGAFKSDLTSSTSDKNYPGTELSPSNATGCGYQVVESSSRFSLSTGELNRITFTGFKYNVDYVDYVSEIKVNSNGDSVMLKFSELYRLGGVSGGAAPFEKAGGSLKIDNLYTDYQCTNVLDRSDKVNDEQLVAYIKWVFDEPMPGIDNYDKIYLEKISKYYTDVVFKDGYTVLADGSVRLDQIKDWTVNELVVPARITTPDGETRNITEIGERALANAKAITLLDLRKADNLTTIGKEAFLHADSLKDIKFAETTAIKNIGDNAFSDTAFENAYAKNHYNAEFIVIGNMIYKYVGEDKEIINLSLAEYYSADKYSEMEAAGERENYNRALAAVTSIEDGAFARCPQLTTLTLSKNITTIRNGALSGLEKFTTLNITALDTATTAAETATPDYSAAKRCALLDIGETAFEGTPFVSEEGSLYSSDLKAIVIGNVYYRFLDVNATSADVPDLHNGFVITHIAPEAFAKCANLKVSFANDAKCIESIGKNAFRDTAMVKFSDSDDNQIYKYTVINGILTEFYSPQANTQASNQILPGDITTISSYAFDKYASYFETIQLNTTLKHIDNYAFNGAQSLKGIILTSITGKDNTLFGAPSIGEYAFANANGEMKEDMLLFFSSSAYSVLTELDSKNIIPTDEITASWLSLYKMNKDHFKQEEISSVVIDSEKISKILYKTSTDTSKSAFEDTYGSDPINDALIITNNTGVQRRDRLSWGANKMEFKLITADNEYQALYKASWTTPHYVLYYEYSGASGKTMVDPNNPLQKDKIFIVEVHNAIKGVPVFYDKFDKTTDNKLQFDNTSVKNANEHLVAVKSNDEISDFFWFTGLEGQIKGEAIPTYYTSCTLFSKGYDSITFNYYDITGALVTIDASKITVNNLVTSSVVNEMSAEITVNFHGLGTYKFTYTYCVKESRYKSIEQVKSINIPVNANATEYLLNTPLNLVGEDGNKRAVNITTDIFGDLPDFNTSNLGMYTAKINYTNNVVEPIIFDVVYSVVLQAEDLYTYEPFNENPGNDYGRKLARITGFKSYVNKTNITTLVIPSIWIDPESGIQYEVTQIGFMQNEPNGVFENMKNLTAVYLPNTVTCIGANTFAGCTSLKFVHSAIQAESTSIKLSADDNNFEAYGDSYKEIVDGVEWTVQPVKLKTFANASLPGGNEIIVAADYEINGAESPLKYRIVAIESGARINVNAADIDLYLPDTIYSIINIVDANGAKINPYLYASNSSFMIKTVDYAPEHLELVAKGAFRDCSSLEAIDLTHAKGLKDVGTMAFIGSGLRSIDLSHNPLVDEVHNEVFENCVNLETVILPNNLISIGIKAFNGCYNLSTLTGSFEKLEYLGGWAFGQASSLTKIELHSSLIKADWTPLTDERERVGQGVFNGCTALTVYCHFGELPTTEDGKYIDVDGWNQLWNSFDCPIVWNCDSNKIADNGFAYAVVGGLRYALNTSARTASVAVQATNLSGDITIPVSIAVDGITYTVVSIEANAFKNNDKIKTVTLASPGGDAKSPLTTIGAQAFANCTALTEFNGADGLTSVGNQAFDGCTSLRVRPEASGAAGQTE